MVLFKSKRESIEEKISSFTFHYGPIQMFFLHIRYVGDIVIYIPLWSYSNSNDEDNVVVLNKFTFHYGPIQIILFFSIFVFQNLIYIPLWSYSNLFYHLKNKTEFSIYIPLWSYSNNIWGNASISSENLHSTMVLFKFTNDLVKKASESIYIPLWSYSNNIWGNASISSENLHSTMVLFKWRGQARGQSLASKFTFHYGPIQM